MPTNTLNLSAYTPLVLSQAINSLPNMYSRVGELGIFSYKPQVTNTVTLEMRRGALSLIPTTVMGGVAPKMKSDSREVRVFSIPSTQLEDTVLASEVMGIRSFGSLQLETVNQVVNDKLQAMKNSIDQTMEWRKLGALKGVVLNADGTTIIEDYFDSFGITKKTINFALDTAGTDVRAKCMEVARSIEDGLMGEMMQRAHVLVSQEFFDKLVSHPKVKEAFSNYAEAATRIGGDMRKGFSFGGLTFEEYRGIVGGKRFIDAGKGHAFPVGTNETFSVFTAPAGFIETVNTSALTYYARQQTKDFNLGIDLHVQSNQLPLVTRPATLVELIAA